MRAAGFFVGGEEARGYSRERVPVFVYQSKREKGQVDEACMEGYKQRRCSP